jgi:dienelactone hydrolase
VQLILDDLADAAVDALRDEAYWRGAAGTAAAADDPPPPPASSSSSSPGSDFRAFGPFSPRRDRVTFYWPPLGFDLAERVTPWVSAVVYTPEAPNSPNGSGRFPAVAFAVGWNSWVERYDATLRQLASHGFIVIAPTVADRRARPLFSFTLLSKHLLASLAWLVRENSRRNSERFFEKVDIEKLGLLGHSSGAGAAVRAAVDAKVRTVGARVDGSVARESDGISGWDADTDTAHAFVSVGIRAVAGLGAFLDSSGLDLDALAHMRGVALFQLAGRLDSHVAPRAVADIAAAAVHAAPRAVGVLRHGTHCFLDEAARYEYPDSQCAAASRGEARVSLADRRDAAATGGSSNASASLFFMSPAAQLEATREYVAAFFVAELRGGGDDFGDDFVSDARERASAAAARWKMWGVEGDDGRKRRASTHSSLAAGGAGGWGNVDETDQPRSSRSRSLSLRAASPVERTGTESFGDPPPVDVTLAEDPRMSRVEVLAWA